MSKRDQPELENRSTSRSQRRRLNFRETILESRTDLSAAPSQSALQAVAVLHWHSRNSREIDVSTPVERGLATYGSNGEKRYILGAEFAITAIAAVVAIARRRADLSSATLPVVRDAQEQHFSMVKILLSEDRRPEEATISGARDSQASSRKSANPLLQDDYLAASTRQKIIVTQADSLVSIAERHFHDGNVGWLIADLNREKLKETFEANKRIVEIANGEFLDLPLWNEIVAFYQGKPDFAIADNLVTIVTRRNIDKEVVETMLASVVDPPTA